jgi:hypothetical protein
MIEVSTGYLANLDIPSGRSGRYQQWRAREEFLTAIHGEQGKAFVSS